MPSIPTRCRSTRSTTTPTRSWRSAVDRAGVSQVDIGGEQKYAVRVQVNPDALASARHRPRGRAHRARRDQRRQAQGQARERAPGGDDRHQRSALQRQAVRERRSSPTATARRCGSRTSARPSIRSSWTASAPGTATSNTDQPAEILLVHRAPDANTVDTVNRIKALLGQLRASIPATGEDRSRLRPDADDPRLGLAMCASPSFSPSASS